MATPPKTHLHAAGYANTACGVDPEWFRITNDTRKVTCKRCRKRIDEFLRIEISKCEVGYDEIDEKFNDLIDQREAYRDRGD